MKPARKRFFVERSLLRCSSSRPGARRPSTNVKSSGASSALQGVRMPRSRQSGYTLIEVIVAFAILALALTLLLGTLTGAVRQVRLSADAGRAALYARSLLDQTGIGESLRPGPRQGEFEGGRYRWTMQVAPYADPLRPAGAAVEVNMPQMLRLTLLVQWGDGPQQRLQLQTLRLVAPSLVP